MDSLQKLVGATCDSMTRLGGSVLPEPPVGEKIHRHHFCLSGIWKDDFALWKSIQMHRGEFNSKFSVKEPPLQTSRRAEGDREGCLATKCTEA